MTRAKLSELYILVIKTTTLLFEHIVLISRSLQGEMLNYGMVYGKLWHMWYFCRGISQKYKFWLFLAMSLTMQPYFVNLTMENVGAEQVNHFENGGGRGTKSSCHNMH